MTIAKRARPRRLLTWKGGRYDLQCQTPWRSLGKLRPSGCFYPGFGRWYEERIVAG